MILELQRSDHFTKNDLDHEKDHDNLNDLDLLDQRSWSLPTCLSHTHQSGIKCKILSYPIFDGYFGYFWFIWVMASHASHTSHNDHLHMTDMNNVEWQVHKGSQGP